MLKQHLQAACGSWRHTPFRKIYAAKTGTAYPRGTQDVFVTALAPADFNETVNTSALPYYAKQRIKDFDRGFDLHVQANQLPTVLKPKALVKVKSTT